jgi:hypothetical protein
VAVAIYHDDRFVLFYAFQPGRGIRPDADASLESAAKGVRNISVDHMTAVW